MPIELIAADAPPGFLPAGAVSLNSDPFLFQGTLVTGGYQILDAQGQVIGYILPFAGTGAGTAFPLGTVVPHPVPSYLFPKPGQVFETLPAGTSVDLEMAQLDDAIGNVAANMAADGAPLMGGFAPDGVPRPFAPGLPSNLAQYPGAGSSVSSPAATTTVPPTAAAAEATAPAVTPRPPLSLPPLSSMSGELIEFAGGYSVPITIIADFALGAIIQQLVNPWKPPETIVPPYQTMPWRPGHVYPPTEDWVPVRPIPKPASQQAVEAIAGALENAIEGSKPKPVLPPPKPPRPSLGGKPILGPQYDLDDPLGNRPLIGGLEGGGSGGGGGGGGGGSASKG